MVHKIGGYLCIFITHDGNVPHDVNSVPLSFSQKILHWSAVNATTVIATSYFPSISAVNDYKNHTTTVQHTLYWSSAGILTFKSQIFGLIIAILSDLSAKFQAKNVKFNKSWLLIQSKYLYLLHKLYYSCIVYYLL